MRETREKAALLHAWVQITIRPYRQLHQFMHIHIFKQNGRRVKTMNAKNPKKITDS